MTSRDFCYWLQGFFELHNAGPKPGEPYDAKALHGYQIEMIEKHLALVFKHEIDPTMGPQKIQDELNKIHGQVTGGPLMRC
jgi:hypothetical protein